MSNGIVTAHAARSDARQGRLPALSLVVLAAAFAWAFWPVIVGLADDWESDANYSVGALVPLVAGAIVWSRRERLRSIYRSPSAWGLAVIAAAALVWAAGTIWLYESLARYALVVTVWGLVLWLAGWGWLRELRWILVFLLLMVPLPGRVHNAFSGGLQTLATSSALLTLEALGITVIREGHVLLLDDQTPVAVAEACSGLRMLAAFVVVAATVAFVVSRPTWHRVAVVLMSVPIAIGVNAVRLVTTALLYRYSDSRIAEAFFHDFAGITMMPMALLCLWGLLALLRWIDPPDAAPTKPAQEAARKRRNSRPHPAAAP